MPAIETADPREQMHATARSLNEHAKPGLTWDVPPAAGANRPGDDFNRRATWEEILEPHGWVVVQRRGDALYLRRPGKEGHVWSATAGHCKTPDGAALLHVFSGSAPPFEPERTYSKFAAYTLLNHSGDYKAAARALAGKGYGEQRTARTPAHETNGQAQPAEAKLPRPEAKIPDPPPWPEPPGKEVYYGLAGDIVRKIEPQTESDPIAILVQFLAMFGNACGRHAYWLVENDRHYPNLYVCLVGETAKSRKGTAMGRARQAFGDLGDDWLKKRVTSGLSSGEGLIKAVRDPVVCRTEEKREGQDTVVVETVVDAGVIDKRLLVVEPEFGRVLRVMEREGNTLSPRLREGWDHGNMTNMTKESTTATGAHLSIIAHITQMELCRLLTDVEATNGLANRFVWTAVKRSKLLPLGGDQIDLCHSKRAVACCVDSARHEREVPFDEETSQWWTEEVYARLTASSGGILGSITNRAESQVRRLALVYALLETTSCVEMPHLKAALALWDHSVRSCRWVFGDSTGDRLADEILAYLRGAGDDGLTQNELCNLFNRHKTSSEIGQSLSVLTASGLAKKSETPTKGRPVTRWHRI